MNNQDRFCLKSNDGRFVVYDGSLGLSASFSEGQWKLGGVFSYMDREENFVLISNEEESSQILEEAKNALGWSAKQFRAG